MPFNAHVTPYRLELGWLSAGSRRRFLTGTLAYSVLAKGSPSYLLPSFSIAADSEIRRSTRNAPENLLYPAHRTEAYRQAFFMRASRSINELHNITFTITESHRFRQQIFNHLYNSDKDDWRRRIAEGVLSFPLP